MEALRLFFSRKMLVVLLLGFSSGIPLALVGSTLQAWMASQKVDLTVIGIFSLVGLPYTLKFVWAPFMDHYVPPFLGRRRGWILLAQISLILTLSGMAFSDPLTSPAIMATLAFLVAFSSASQDIVIDAYKTEILEVSEFGVGASVANFGFRMAMLFSGALALIMADHISWNKIYLIMAASMSVGLITNLFMKEPETKVKIPKTLVQSIIEPLSEFFKRKKVFELIAFVTFYKLDVVMALALMTPFLMELGFTKTDIGAVTKGFGLFATLLGTFIGGAWMKQLGIHRSLWVFGILQGISGILFYALAKTGYHYPLMVATISAENFFSGMGNAAYAAFIMSLCNPKYTATQFALLTSLMALTRTLAGAPTGWMAKNWGWETYFLVSIFLAIPSLLLLTRYKEWMKTK